MVLEKINHLLALECQWNYSNLMYDCIASPPVRFDQSDIFPYIKQFPYK